MTHSSQCEAEKFWVRWQTNSFKPHTESSWNLKTDSFLFLHCITSKEASLFTHWTVNVQPSKYFGRYLFSPHPQTDKKKKKTDTLALLWLPLGYCHVSSVCSKMLFLFICASQMKRFNVRSVLYGFFSTIYLEYRASKNTDILLYYIWQGGDMGVTYKTFIITKNKIKIK